MLRLNLMPRRESILKIQPLRRWIQVTTSFREKGILQVMILRSTGQGMIERRKKLRKSLNTISCLSRLETSMRTWMIL